MSTPYQRAIWHLADQQADQTDTAYELAAARAVACAAWEKTDDQVVADVRRELNRRAARARRDQVPMGSQA